MREVNEKRITEAGRRLAAAAPNAQVILFGSHARGEAGPHSDIDVLVIELARSGTKVAQLATTFGVSDATIYNWLKQERIDTKTVPDEIYLQDAASAIAALKDLLDRRPFALGPHVQFADDDAPPPV